MKYKNIINKIHSKWKNRKNKETNEIIKRSHSAAVDQFNKNLMWQMMKEEYPRCSKCDCLFKPKYTTHPEKFCQCN